MATTSSASVKMMKRQWTPIEDEKLVESLYELYTMGSWKCDTGFKSGYLVQLEKMMEQKLPGCGVKATPHIESRVKTLKKQTMAIAEMFSNGSGFGWNDELKMVLCEKHVFDLWTKSHPSAKGLRNKTFPHYDTLLEIFGKDRANGKEATTPAGEEEEIETDATNEFNQSVPIDGLESMDFSSIETQPPTPTSQASGKRQRRSSDSWNRGMLEISSSMNKLVDGTMLYLDKIGKAMGEDSAKSDAVADALQTIDGLTLLDILDVAKAIINDSSMTTVFLRLSDEKRKEMVYQILNKTL